MVEHSLGKGEVTSSSLVKGSFHSPAPGMLIEITIQRISILVEVNIRIYLAIRD